MPNGKEHDPEWKGEGAIYDYGFRIYDPRIAKFLSIDPLAEQYPWYTPYQFAGNSPIAFIDIDGAEIGVGTLTPEAVYGSLFLNEGNALFGKAESAIRGAGEYIVNHPGEAAHIALDAAGLVPGIGEFADGANAIFYLIEGEYVEAGVSALAIVPVLGEGGKAAKYAVKTVKAGSNTVEIADKATKVFKTAKKALSYLKATKRKDLLAAGFSEKVVNTILSGGKLREALKRAGEYGSGKQAHHIVPIELIKVNEIVMEAVDQGFDFHGAVNGIALGADRHYGSHPNYNSLMNDVVNYLAERNPNWSPIQVVTAASQHGRTLIQTTEGKINNILNPFKATAPGK